MLSNTWLWPRVTEHAQFSSTHSSTRYYRYLIPNYLVSYRNGNFWYRPSLANRYTPMHLYYGKYLNCGNTMRQSAFSGRIKIEHSFTLLISFIRQCHTIWLVIFISVSISLFISMRFYLLTTTNKLSCTISTSISSALSPLSIWKKEKAL